MNIGNVSILDLRVGGIPVQSVYDGEHLVWTREYPAGDYWGLCFTAKEANSTVAMTAETGAPAVTLEYSTNANDWSPFTVGSTTVTLARVGDKVWMRAGSGGNQSFCSTSKKRNNFVLTGKVAASGNIMSLLNGEQQLTNIPSTYCFANLFFGCTSLVTPPELPATSLANYCYSGMFQNCTSLSVAPELPAETLNFRCYEFMFLSCTSLSVAPELPATTLADNCYDAMFVSCYSLTQVPQLPGNMVGGCYASMFRSCINLQTPPSALFGTSIPSNGCIQMFEDCSSLTSMPDIQATTAGSGGMYHMFYRCSNLTKTTPIRVTQSSSSGMNQMFYGCSKLSSIEVEFTSWPGNTRDWVYNVAPNGIFTCPTALGTNETITRGSNNCPTNWIVVNTDSYWGLCFTAEEANSTVAMTAETGAPAVTLEYSTNIKDWSPFTVGSTTVTLADVGDKVWIRAGSGGNQGMTQNEKVNTFTMTGKVAASGNIMSLLDGYNKLTAIPVGNCFYKLFSDCTSLVSPPELPATSLQVGSYHTMFKGCTNLTAVPELPATSVLPAACYQHMFDGCTSLSNANIVLSATTLADSSYAQMFIGCTSLTSAPVISAQTAAIRSCWSMFEGCSSLSAAPVLPATSLAPYCYQNMFNGCTSLTQAPALPAMALAGQCYQGMFSGCTSLTQAPSLPAASLANYCYYDMFSGCTSLTQAPVLSAMTLADNCYWNMFANCTSLTQAPALPATTLKTQCYFNMFYGCTSLTAASELPATELKQACYNSMFSGCTSLTQAPALPATTLANQCYTNMFRNCTNLSSVEVMFTSWSDTASWLYKVASNGTFTCPTALGTNETITRGGSNCPENWTVVNLDA